MWQGMVNDVNKLVNKQINSYRSECGQLMTKSCYFLIVIYPG